MFTRQTSEFGLVAPYPFNPGHHLHPPPPKPLIPQRLDRKQRHGTVMTIGRGIRPVVFLFENLSSFVEKADRRLMEEDGSFEEQDARSAPKFALERMDFRSPVFIQPGKAFCAIFTSPPPAEGSEEETAEGPARKKRTTAGRRKPRKGMLPPFFTWKAKLQAVQSLMRQSLYEISRLQIIDASQWSGSYNGFNYMGFYNFLVGYFEEFRSDASKTRVNALLVWSNRWSWSVETVSLDADDLSRKRATSPLNNQWNSSRFLSILVTHGHSEFKVALDERDRGVTDNAEVQTSLS
ncbi:hypothetical protein GALMADRAFT_214351 [Galerina marginata CBS 339.88]|uniref:Uncharacterized protein n=1 Tax=Galerina marginata (strain CBS 339.88) TaxID=685588 RepID=A0A067SUX6_GALM3|nr:hypothetical protein GALMADRAFT_214351 [Galerina marginata CBS 339.88]